MFGDFLRRLTAPDPQPLSDPDARLALGALLVRIARTDGDYAKAEIAQIDAALGRRFDLDADGAAELRAQCEVLESEAPDTVRFTRAIKDAVGHDDRLALVEAMWAVVLADGVRDQEEDSLMRMVVNLLGITDQESHAARLRISNGT
ncbi:tellurite resistance TerB family protein [Yoonia sediminilitoris]|uniref:Putative tellurite resistance protein B-like protein n=1 Tax=Yoonia sediminilitoris TaxID=1286148 RepID=A0A2T6KEY2_9RHOB|nr:TerB family tellurite resistance protein [Yoonia sediminilitoris]PUB13681.1 putative tellurite resistance protein B-like protein [Yoonia sediminilitoris]RCW94851.1 putative tellurite resistance protein B-like protein [Yoonia sediminilitoris]